MRWWELRDTGAFVAAVAKDKVQKVPVYSIWEGNHNAKNTDCIKGLAKPLEVFEFERLGMKKVQVVTLHEGDGKMWTKPASTAVEVHGEEAGVVLKVIAHNRGGVEGLEKETRATCGART